MRFVQFSLSMDTPDSSSAEQLAVDEQQRREAKEKSEADKAMCSLIQTKLTAGVREANTLPKLGDQFELCQSFPIYARFMVEQKKRILSLIRRLLTAGGCKTLRVPESVDDFDEFFDRIVEANDSILERAGISMDELQRSRIRKIGLATEVIVPELAMTAQSTTAKIAAMSLEPSSATGFKLPLQMKARRLPAVKVGDHSKSPRIAQPAVSLRPQNAFRDSIDNSHEPFVTKLRVKHHARIRKEGAITVRDTASEWEHSRNWLSDAEVCAHPYQYELDRFEPTERQLELGEISDVQTMDQTPLVIVDSLPALEKLRDTLNGCKEFAVDLEHHDFHTYLGFTSLVQISTADTDYIVDPFGIWTEMQMLNEPFTNPNIVKIMHGAERDIEWLQRDFGIYVVNLFDTGRAMHQLHFNKFGLQYLVGHYCDVHLSKEMQCSDWRIRPLTPEMMDYARGDTHYLLHCYDRLRKELLEQGNDRANLLRAVYDESRQICLKIYEKPQFDPEGYRRLLIGRRSAPNNRQQAAFAGLWKWRDSRARALDESLQYVLPNHMLISIAETLPRELQGIFQCCSPTPLIIRQDAHELHRIIHAARDRPLEKKIAELERSLTRLSASSFLENAPKRALHMLIRSPHDFTYVKHDEELRPMVIPETAEKIEDSDMANKAMIFGGPLGFVKSTGTIEIPGDLPGTTRNSTAVNVKAILDKINRQKDEWASPFDCYTIAINERKLKEEEEAIKQREARKRKQPAGKTNDQGTVSVEDVTDEALDSSPKKRWSHHDPSSGLVSGYVEQKDEYLTPTQLAVKRREAVQSTGLIEEQMLTKKALQKKRKMLANAADVSFKPVASSSGAVVEQQVEERSTVFGITQPIIKRPGADKKQKRTWTDAVPLENPTDFSQYSPEMFNVKHQRGNGPPVFDPFRQSQRSEKRGGGGGGGRRGRGGRGRGGGRGNGRGNKRRDPGLASASVSYR